MSGRLSMRPFVALGVTVAVALALFLSPYASSSPDGLEKVAGDHGFQARGKVHRVQDRSPIPGYAFPGIGDPRVATALAGLAGTLGVFAFAYGTAVVVRRTRS
jgi:cobalt/nickel transport protein